MKPLASFVIPVKDGQAFIAQAVHSCLSQNYQRIEVVVVNDGSTDGTKKRLDYMKDKDDRLRVIDLPENKGRSYARNIGCSEVKSEIIMVLDADDIALQSRAGDTVNFFKKNPATDICYGGFQKIDPLGVVMQSEMPRLFNPEEMNVRKEFMICHSTMAFRKKVFEKVQYTGGEFSTLGIDDWKFQMDAYKAGFKFLAIPKIISQYRLEMKERDEKRVMELKLMEIEK